MNTSVEKIVHKVYTGRVKKKQENLFYIYSRLDKILVPSVYLKVF